MLAFALTTALSLGVLGCRAQPTAASRAGDPPAVLQASWKAYVGRFIQADGRVIDH